MVIKQGRLNWMSCRGCLGRSTVGCFLLAICCCLVSVTAARGARPQLPRERDQSIGAGPGDRAHSQDPHQPSEGLDDLASTTCAPVFPGRAGQDAHRHFVRMVRGIYGHHVSGAQEPKSGVGDAERFGATVWMAEILACRALESPSHLGAAGAHAASSSDAAYGGVCPCNYCAAVEMAADGSGFNSGLFWFVETCRNYWAATSGSGVANRNPAPNLRRKANQDLSGSQLLHIRFQHAKRFPPATPFAASSGFHPSF